MDKSLIQSAKLNLYNSLLMASELADAIARASPSEYIEYNRVSHELLKIVNLLIEPG